MDHGLMQGMLIGGILMSAVPLLLGIALGVLAWRHHRAELPEDEHRPGR